MSQQCSVARRYSAETKLSNDVPLIVLESPRNITPIYLHVILCQTFLLLG